MLGIFMFENYFFIILFFCSLDFLFEYGEEYRDCVLVFWLYGGFMKKVFEMVIDKGFFYIYCVFFDGLYGGMC